VFIALVPLAAAADDATAAPGPLYKIISRGEAAGPYQAFPDVCRLAGGDVCCVFYAGYGHVSLPSAEWPKGGRICMVRSADEGRTWTEPATLFDDDRDNRDPHIAQMSDGTLVCSFFSLDIGFPGHAPHFTRLGTGEILLTHRVPATSLHVSRDECRTWNGPYQLDAVGGAYPATVELKDGAVLAVYYTEGEGSHVRALRFRLTADGIENLPLD
jgi:hypothetical protein